LQKELCFFFFKELMKRMEIKPIFISDTELDLLGYTRQGLIWIIAGQRYRCKEATATGYYFVKLD
jgi:hypothetical protein